MTDLDTIVREQEEAADDGVRPASALRPAVIAAALAEEGTAEGLALDRFLHESDFLEALRHWFGLALEGGDAAWVAAMLARDIAAIDMVMSDHLDEILHHRAFKRLEASWRGVDYLINEARGDDRVRVRILNATWAELARDFDRAIEFDQSVMFSKIYSEEYGMPGGVPFGLLLCDYQVRHRPMPGSGEGGGDDVATLAGLAQVAAASFSPCIVSAAPELLGVTSFSDLSYAQRIDSGFRLTEYQRWQKLREQEESRFLGVVLPRVLMRDRHGDSSARMDGFPYVEGGTGLDSWLWGNAVYAFGAVTIRCFRESGWFADIRGTRMDHDGVGLVNGLEAPAFSTREAAAFRRPLEVELTDKKQKALEDLGFISLSPCAFTESVVFLGAQSLHAPTSEGDTAERVNARLSAMLQYVMCVSRFAHYVKVMARDMVGGFQTVPQMTRFLSEWLRQYTIGNLDAGPELKARYPLSSATLEIKEIPGRPGVMSCVMHLQPHFQFDQLITGFRIRTEIEAAGKGGK